VVYQKRLSRLLKNEPIQGEPVLYVGRSMIPVVNCSWLMWRLEAIGGGFRRTSPEGYCP
jgi:hypothetical protein